MTPGVYTMGIPELPSCRAKWRSPPIPPVSSGAAKKASRKSVSVAAPEGINGSPYPDGPATISGCPGAVSSRTNRAGSPNASAVGQLRSRYSSPSSKPQTSMLTVPGSMPTARIIRLLLLGELFPARRLAASGLFLRNVFAADQLPGNIGDGFCIEHQVIASKQACDAGLVQLGLEIPYSKCAKGYHAIVRLTGVVDVYPLDTERRHRVEIHRNLQAVGSGPRTLGHHLNTGRAGIEEDLHSIEQLGQSRRIIHRQGIDLDVEAGADKLPGLLALLRLAGGNGHLGPAFGQQPRGTLAHWTGACQNQDLLARDVAECLLDFDDGCDGGRVGAVRVQHDRHRERRKQGILGHRQELFAGGHVVTADPDGGVMQVLGTSGEDAPVDQIPNITFGHSTITHHDVGAGIVRNDLIERARESRAVELKQELTHGTLHLLTNSL